MKDFVDIAMVSTGQEGVDYFVLSVRKLAVSAANTLVVPPKDIPDAKTIVYFDRNMMGTPPMLSTEDSDAIIAKVST